ncbi:unnamed protein product [Lupinus luteus]|uniref:glucan endo-1,3-beta-D-glucosidase n=1 Tax=Lupinus luteus TaxID=3873 RepID=A0AAV1WR59_LUPLU
MNPDSITCLGIGVNYGMVANNLPPPKTVVGLYQKCGIELMRLFDPNPEVSEALRGSNIKVSLGVRNQDIPNLASSPEAATQWVNTNVAPYKDDINFQWITVGNEVIPGQFANDLPQAMQNVHDAITSIGLNNTKVTTSMFMLGLESTYPPSSGAFKSEIVEVMKSVTAFLAKTGAPLMANVYPYFAYKSNPKDVSIDYAMFQTNNPIIDGGLKYFSLFDAMVDSIYAALEKIGARNVPLIIGETGWPSAGSDPYTSKEKAKLYNQNLLNYLNSGKGTPRRPGQVLSVFIFAMFNENLKTPPGEENNFGLFYPDMNPVYPLLQC